MKDKNTKISIIMPVYNTELESLKRSIESAINQTYTDFELLIVDDGSIDDIATWLDTYTLVDTRIKIFHQVNQGVSSARNTALSNARGMYLTFLDSDDYMEPNMLEVLVETMCDEHTIIGACGHYMHQNGVTTKYSYAERDTTLDTPMFFRAIMESSLQGFLCNKIFKAQYLENLKLLENLKIGEDLHFINLVLKNAPEDSTYVISPLPLYHYIVHTTNATNLNSMMKNSQDWPFYTMYQEISRLYDGDKHDYFKKLKGVSVIDGLFALYPYRKEYPEVYALLKKRLTTLNTNELEMTKVTKLKLKIINTMPWLIMPLRSLLKKNL